MLSFQEMLTAFVILWAVIDPIGTMPVFMSATRGFDAKASRRVARVAALWAAAILLFFIVVGEILLRAMGVPLIAFQVAGGLILFLFALTMVFGESKPESEARVARDLEETAIFPLATPSIASPGAMMAVVLLTENSRHSILEQALTTAIMLVVVAAAYVFMIGAGRISRFIGSGGASVISRVMGMILASIAATNVLTGIRTYFT